MLRFTNFLRVFVLLDILLVGADNQQSEFRRQSLNLKQQERGMSLPQQDYVAPINERVNALTEAKKQETQARLL